MSARAVSLRKSNLALSLLALLGAGFVATLLYSAYVTQGDETRHSASKTVVHQLGLSDLALFTEARYTRHPSQADLHTAFQDHPVSLDHFPSGSLIAPPSSFGPGASFATDPLRQMEHGKKKEQ